MPGEYEDPAMSRQDKTELRGLAPIALVQALDAIAMARGLDRNTYIVSILESHVRSYLDEISVVTRAMHGNPLLTEPKRSPAP